MKRFTLGLATIALVATSFSAIAATGPDTPEKQPTPVIATKADASEDGDITARIRSIFGEIVALRGVGIRVSAGIVTLAGTVPSAEDKDRAEAIASRVAGVVTVQNGIVRPSP